MHGLTLHAPGDLRHESVPEPSLRQPTDAIVRVLKTAICGSDLHGYNGREAGLDPGTVVGHEFVGEVIDVGSEVVTLQRGVQVVGAFSTSCGQCRACRAGLTARCSIGGEVFGWVSDGVGLAGAQAEYLRVPLADGTLVAIPDDLDAERALFAGDVLSTGLFCAESGGASPGNIVVVLGAGPVGLAAAMAGLYTLVLAWDYPRDYFELTIPDGNVWGVALGAVAAAGALIVAIPLIVPGIRMAKQVDNA